MMKRVSLAAATVCAAAVLSPLTASAGLFRAYLSSPGQPSADCTLAHPCRYLPDAIAAVASGGEIWMLDSANFNQGAVNINKSVTILAVPGEVGSIQAIGSNSVAVSVATPGVDVTLRNVVISANAISPGGYGIYITNGNSVTVEDSVLADLRHKAIFVTGPTHVRLEDTTLRNEREESIFADGGAILDVIHCKLTGSGFGGISAVAAAGATTVVNVTDSVISGVSTAQGVGIDANAASGGAVRAYVTGSTIFQTAYGLEARGAGSAMIQVSGSMVVRNLYNVNISGSGVVYSLGNNHISDGEQADGGSLTTLLPR